MALAIVATIGIVLWVGSHQAPKSGELSEFSSQSKHSAMLFSPTPAQWATLTVEPVVSEVFRTRHETEGKIAIDEDRSTPIFSPYAGRVTKLLVAPGETVQRGQPMFIVEAADSVQAQNDFLVAVGNTNKARSQLNLTQGVEKRLHSLYEGKAAALKDWQQAQADVTAAENDLHSAESALEATRNRLRILGKTDDEIATFQQQGIISPDAPVRAPIGGTIVARKVGPGQYISSGSTDPVFIIGDLSTVWLIAYVRETEASKVMKGQSLTFTILADPSRVYEAKIAYAADTLDPATRRLLVRASINNADGQLKPEMFASVSIFTDTGQPSPGVPRDAVIYEGERARVWVARDDGAIELREIKTGLTKGRMVQVPEGLRAGERVITKGSLFIDRAAIGS